MSKCREGKFLKYEAPMVCFSEIRLSRAKDHADRYGRLGVGVGRDFVLDRCGGPVLYVRNGPTGHIVPNIDSILSAVQGNEDARAKLAAVAAFFKAMSRHGTSGFEYLEEQEWRVIHLHRLVDAGHVARRQDDPSKYALVIPPDQIRVIVFPDAETRSMCVGADWFRERLPNPPSLLTLQDCAHL